MRSEDVKLNEGVRPHGTGSGPCRFARIAETIPGPKRWWAAPPPLQAVWRWVAELQMSVRTAHVERGRQQIVVNKGCGMTPS